jgi:hypothetical protein
MATPHINPSAPAPAQQPRRSHIGWIIVGVVSVFLIACCVLGIVLVEGTSHTSVFSNVINIGPEQPAATNTSAPRGPQPIFAPVLGGTVADFTQLYGLPQNPADATTGLWLQFTIVGHPIMSLSVDAAPANESQDGQLHIMDLSVQAPRGTTWSSTTQQQILAALIPSDATFERQQSTRNGNERLYTSAQLAATFNPDLFTNQAGTRTVAPGTFFEQCKLGNTPIAAGGAANACVVFVGVY